MPYYPPKPRKRGYYTKKSAGGTRRYKKATVYAASKLQAVVRRAIAQNNSKMIETKQANSTYSDGVEIVHNNYQSVTDQLLKTTQGVTDPTNFNTQCRIGDTINLIGVKLGMMLELNERYSDVTFRILVVKCAKGDTPTRANLFNGLAGNKMLDTINKERFTVIAQKWVKIKAPNVVPIGDNGGTTEISLLTQGTGVYQQTGNTWSNRLSRATKIVKMWIPGTKFNKSGIIRYEDGSAQVKFFDYHVLVYAYSNYSTYQDVWAVGRINDYIQTLYYKDA